jgi:hypothetical protein
MLHRTFAALAIFVLLGCYGLFGYVKIPQWPKQKPSLDLK